MADNYCACNGGDDAEYIVELNQQGPPGVQGEQGYSPVVSYTMNNNVIQFTLVNEDTVQTTPNFYNYLAKKSVVDNHSILIQNNTLSINNLQTTVGNHTNQINTLTSELGIVGNNKLDKNGSNAYDPCIINNIKLGNAPSGYNGAISLSNAGKLLISNGGTGTQGNRAELQLGTTGSTLFGNNVVTIQSNEGINLYTLGKAYYKQYGVASSEIATVGDIPTKTSDLTNDSDFITSSDLPTVGNGTITLTQGGVTKGTFTTNQSGNTTIDLDAGGGAITNPLIIEDDVTNNEYRVGFVTVGGNRKFNSGIYLNGQTGYSVGDICTAISFNPLTYVDASTFVPELAGAKLLQFKYDNNTLKVNQDGQLYADISAPTYTAGTNIQISNENVISATDTTYTAGTGIDITNDIISIDNTVALKTDIPTNYVTTDTTQTGSVNGITGNKQFRGYTFVGSLYFQDSTNSQNLAQTGSTNGNFEIYTFSNKDINIAPNGTGLFKYNDVEVATVNDIPDVSNYYTKAQVDALLQAKQDLIDALTTRITALETNINGGNA